jgi:hypothetical protein
MIKKLTGTLMVCIFVFCYSPLKAYAFFPEGNFRPYNNAQVVNTESKNYNQMKRAGCLRPFETKDKVVICSYHFAAKMADEIASVSWDLVVMDEAHRLRNVYKPSNIIGNTLKIALANKKKLLLTATPLQNSLMELYGLVSIIDEHVFGDVKTYRDMYINIDNEEIRNIFLRQSANVN